MACSILLIRVLKHCGLKAELGLMASSSEVSVRCCFDELMMKLLKSYNSEVLVQLDLKEKIGC